MPTAAKSKRRVERACAVGGAELRLKGLLKSDRRRGGANLVRCRKFRPVAGGLYRSLTGYVVKLKTDAGKVRFIGPRGMARLQSRAKRFDTQSEAKYAAESTIASGYGKVRSAIVVKVVAGAKQTSGRKSLKNGAACSRTATARLAMRNTWDEDEGDTADEEDDFDLQSEMREGVVIQQTGRLGGGPLVAYSSGREVASAKTMAGVLRKVSAWMKSQGYYPNIFFVNDHGNTDLIDTKGKTHRSWV